jgi:hypothetical protein
MHWDGVAMVPHSHTGEDVMVVLRLCAAATVLLTGLVVGRPNNTKITAPLFALMPPLNVVDQVYAWARSVLKWVAGTAEAVMINCNPDACELSR